MKIRWAESPDVAEWELEFLRVVRSASLRQQELNKGLINVV